MKSTFPIVSLTSVVLGLAAFVGSTTLDDEAEAKPVHYSYHDGVRWPADTDVICVELEDAWGWGSTVLKEPALEYSEWVETVGRESCDEYEYVIEVVLTTDLDGATGWFDILDENDAGEITRGEITFDVGDAYKMTPEMWQALARHELGHGFGLKHAPKNANSIMVEGRRIYEIGELTENDREQLDLIWSDR